MSRNFWQAVALAFVLGACAGACDTARPLRPLNRDPVVLSLTVFPGTIGLVDSAIVVCDATDPDGDTLVYDWSSDCRLVMRGAEDDLVLSNSCSKLLVVRPGTCIDAPLDTGWVSCEVRDGRGGGAYAGHVQVIVQSVLP